MYIIGNNSNAIQIINDMRRSQGILQTTCLFEKFITWNKKAISTVDKGFKKTYVIIGYVISTFLYMALHFPQCLSSA